MGTLHKVGSTLTGEFMNYYHLPEEYHLRHEACFTLHDIMVDLIKAYEDGDAFSIVIPNFAEVHHSRDELSTETWEWLDKNGYKDQIYFRSVVPGIATDFLHHIHTALETTAKCKMSVAYTLFRKPFYDHLFILEWLVSDRNGFFDTFSDLNFAQIANKVHIDQDKDGRRREFIEKTLATILDIFPNSVSTSASDADLIYDIRYNKDCEYGFQKECNTAAHLITTHRNWTTKPEDMNFIFLGQDDVEDLWDHLYYKLMLILMYALETVMILLNEIEDLDPETIKEINTLCQGIIMSLAVELEGEEFLDDILSQD